jgi:hypothetical protein
MLIHSVPVTEYHVMAPPASAITALTVLMHGLDTADLPGMTYRVLAKDNNEPLTPGKLGITGDFPRWEWPGKNTAVEEPKQPSVNLGAFDPAQKMVITYLMEEADKTRQAFEERDREIESLRQACAYLNQQVQLMQRMGQIHRNVAPTPPFNWQPPGGARYQPHRDTVPPSYNDRPDYGQPFFSEEVDFSQPPDRSAWGRPPRR